MAFGTIGGWGANLIMGGSFTPPGRAYRLGLRFLTVQRGSTWSDRLADTCVAMQGLLPSCGGSGFGSLAGRAKSGSRNAGHLGGSLFRQLLFIISMPGYFSAVDRGLWAFALARWSALPRRTYCALGNTAWAKSLAWLWPFSPGDPVGCWLAVCWLMIVESVVNMAAGRHRGIR